MTRAVSSSMEAYAQEYWTTVILIIDNYDSFTYNLVQLVGGLAQDAQVKVIRNDVASVDEVEHLNPGHLLLSPGPGTPNRAGICMQLIDRFAGRIPILGVCLGHQCIAACFGARVTRAYRVLHGKTSQMFHDESGIFRNLPNPMEVGRYHSLIVDREGLCADLQISAWTAEEEIMGLRHRSMPIEGVQFHPESFLTPRGHQLLENFFSASILKEPRVTRLSSR